MWELWCNLEIGHSSLILIITVIIIIVPYLSPADGRLPFGYLSGIRAAMPKITGKEERELH